mmetsp:Transcript_18434/g.63981  ORF Transcript_18434/g.63981 Transcript_18434/m.63981 type:complete len:230 (+) Transcript_18434:33-722(+)
MLAHLSRPRPPDRSRAVPCARRPDAQHNKSTRHDVSAAHGPREAVPRPPGAPAPRARWSRRLSRLHVLLRGYRRAQKARGVAHGEDDLLPVDDAHDRGLRRRDADDRRGQVVRDRVRARGHRPRLLHHRTLHERRPGLASTGHGGGPGAPRRPRRRHAEPADRRVPAARRVARRQVLEALPARRRARGAAARGVRGRRRRVPQGRRRARMVRRNLLRGHHVDDRRLRRL